MAQNSSLKVVLLAQSIGLFERRTPEHILLVGIKLYNKYLLNLISNSEKLSVSSAELKFKFTIMKSWHKAR